MLPDKLLFTEDPRRGNRAEVAEPVGPSEFGRPISPSVEIEDIFLVPYIFEDSIKAQVPVRGLIIGGCDRSTLRRVAEQRVRWETGTFYLIRILQFVVISPPVLKLRSPFHKVLSYSA